MHAFLHCFDAALRHIAHSVVFGGVVLVAVILVAFLVEIMADIIVDTVGSLIGATGAPFPDDNEGRQRRILRRKKARQQMRRLKIALEEQQQNRSHSVLVSFSRQSFRTHHT